MKQISIIHPSRNRASMAFETLNKWLYNADFVVPIQYILSIDSTDEQYNKYLMILDCIEGVEIVSNDNKSAIEAINFGATKATGDLLIVVSDDTDTFKGWDTALIKALDGKSDFSVKTKDGIQKTLITMPIVDREYYNRFGYIYKNDYKHMFVDMEFTAVGMMMDKVITLDLEFKHLHYSIGAMDKDEVNERNNSTWQQGERLFNERLKSNFGLKPEEIVNPYESIVWH